MQRKKLPIGIQTFRQIREADYYYVDKTPHILRLIAEGKAYFLSRPRRFGKSLLLDTIAELFAGNRVLFSGLYAEQHWDWQQTHPVVRISFAEGMLQSRAELDIRIHEILHELQQAHGVVCDNQSVAGRFSELLRKLHQQHGQRVVVLVDEYDKPILDNITNPEVAKAMRDGLRNLYSVIKGQDAHIGFAMLTGVSKFSKVSLFSGLNNLKDITLDARYSAVCGYTEHDVDTVFAPELFDLDRSEIKRWYNGYNWLGESVYNPFDLLLLFDNREFRPYWFETGTPQFLIKILTYRHVFAPALEHLLASENLLSKFDVEDMSTESLMFQSGYLTVGSVKRVGVQLRYALCYPNQEVRSCLTEALLHGYTNDGSQVVQHYNRLHELLLENDFKGLQQLFTAFFASIPYDWYRHSPIAQYEGYYASIFYSHFAALGLDIRLEDMTHQGRIDMTLLFNEHIYIFEFKVVELVPEGRALQQIIDKGYANKYLGRGHPIHQIGVEFSKQKRSVVGFEVLSI